MSQTSIPSWEEANQTCLMAAVHEVRAKLAKLLSLPETPTVTVEEEPAAQNVSASTGPPSALETLSARFGLSSFERKILLMCAGVELDSGLASLYAAANKDLRHSLPTFSLALAAFEDAHWSALLPSEPLRYWHLLEVLPSDVLTTSPLRIDERILHYLAGVPSMDERLRGLTEPLSAAGTLPASQCTVAEQVAGSWSRAGRESPWPVVQLCGSDLAGKRAVATAACALAGLNLRAISASVVPRNVAEVDLFVRLWEREAALDSSGLLLEYDEAETTDAQGDAALKRLVETLRSPLLVSTRERYKPVERRLLSYDVPAATSAEQLEIWKEALGPAASALDGRVETLVSQFSLSAGSIHAAAAQGLQLNGAARPSPAGPGDSPSDSSVAGAEDKLAAALWDACRMQARPRLEGLAQRIEPSATWDDLVLPERQRQLLHQIALHVRQRTRVYQTWGFAGKCSRGLGISALFAGPSGTGKTMAGEVLANELRLDLYRIDLSQVVSKYIGETEKNLRRVFDAAEGGAAILLFDEADALFGKRSEVKDSHDRYANIEVGYLLQRMESYRGLAILTTNRKDALDFAFLRRIRFVAEFPYPESAQRAEIWRRVFPRQTPTEGLRIDRLARLSAAGGNIHNIAMGAAFLAADAGEPVRMSHLLSAARSEFTKLERPLTDAETAGWV
jgi:ATPase family associated with various cellular activities (AAA)/Winged helix domain, variant